MLTEMLGKGGNVCSAARSGEIRCPLIVRPTSEDVITGQLFQSLGLINPRWWLPQLLNRGLGTPRFRQQVFRQFKIELWKNRPPYPRRLLPWDEGSTQVDATVTWENSASTVFFELKYRAELSRKTAGDDGSTGYPSDQLIRNLRVGLLECGWFQENRLFQLVPRDFALILITPSRGNLLVDRYRDTQKLRASIPHAHRLPALPKWPILGELSYGDIIRTLREQRRFCTQPERRTMDQLADYLEFKSGGTGGNSEKSDGGYDS